MLKKGKIKFILLPILVLVAALFISLFIAEGSDISKDQYDVIEVFDYPHQFVVTYVPGGTEEDPTLVRTEVWYYPEYEMQITFLAGDLYNIEDYKNEELLDVSPTTLKPEQFSFNSTYDEVGEIVGKDSIDKLDFVPGFYEEDVLETYISDKILFIYENGYLTYVQTLGLGTDVKEDLMDIRSEGETEDVKTNTNDEANDITSEKDSPNSGKNENENSTDNTSDELNENLTSGTGNGQNVLTETLPNELLEIGNTSGEIENE